MFDLCGFKVGDREPFFLMAGPCVIESEALAMETAQKLKEITEKLGINFVYKSSFDKANRSSIKSFRGLGFSKGLEILAKVKKELGVNLITDVHEDTPLDEVVMLLILYKRQHFLRKLTLWLKLHKLISR